MAEKKPIDKQAVVNKSMAEMAANKGPGQAQGEKHGLRKAEIANPTASKTVHKGPWN